MTATWITELGPAPVGAVRLAVKDAIDVAGIPTTNGSRAVAATAAPATADATCVARLRSSGAVVVGKTNLHELCFGTTGINPVYGTPTNPRHPGLVPGGSSSGSAAAVTAGEADVALGTDTGGSIRIPAACCGVVGLKTTHGLIPLDGVAPLAPTLDTVGPLAATVAGIVTAMTALVPGFTTGGVAPAGRIARIRPTGIDVDPDIDEAVDLALASAGHDVVDVAVGEWHEACDAMATVLLAQAWRAQGHLLGGGGVAEPVRTRLEIASAVTGAQETEAAAFGTRWVRELRARLSVAPVAALPTLVRPPDPVDGADPGVPNWLCAPINLAGWPAISLPLTGPPGSALQLVGGAGAEALLCSTAAAFER